MNGRAFRRDEHGAALVETAIVLSLFVALVFGIIEFGYAWYVRNSIATAAREGARWAIVRGSQSGRAANATAIAAHVETLIPFRQPGAVSVTVTPPGGPGAPGTVVQVVVHYNYQPLIGAWTTARTWSDTSRMVVSY
jgi:Flp pilus assembly protein TadG